ncbi:MAG: cytochrome o ubiquinol oxidase subunit IV [Acidiferrobacteraceae bacterium]
MDEDMTFARELRDYILGLIAALVLTGIAFSLVAWSHWSSAHLFLAIGICAVLQLIAQFRFFLHIDLKKSHRDDLQLILFSGLIIALMVAGTLWIIYNQYMRMM